MNIKKTDVFSWLDIEKIVELLEEAYPHEDLLRLRFTDLKHKILNLEGFEGAPQHSNEKILEAIQAAWIELRQDYELD